MKKSTELIFKLKCDIMDARANGNWETAKRLQSKLKKVTKRKLPQKERAKIEKSKKEARKVKNEIPASLLREN